MILFYLVLTVSALVAALVDFTYYRIPNICVGFILFLFLGFAVYHGNWHFFKTSLVIFGFTFVVCYTLYYFNLLGAGDAKLLSVISLWATPNPVYFFLATSLAGALLSGWYAFAPEAIDSYRLSVREFLSKTQGTIGTFFSPYQEIDFEPVKRGTPPRIFLPYGVAIFIGCLVLTFYIS